MNDTDDMCFPYETENSIANRLKLIEEEIDKAQPRAKSTILIERLKSIANQSDLSIHDILSMLNKYNNLSINDLDILDIFNIWQINHDYVQSVAEKIGLRLKTRIPIKKENNSSITEHQLRREGILEGQHLIDHVLGKYDPDKREIILYLENIKNTANNLGYSENSLTKIIEIHEAAHAVIHLGIDADGLDFDTNSYKGVDRGKFRSQLHETLAQLICYHFIKDLNKYFQVFETLNYKQPEEYQLWKEFKDIPLERVRSTLIEIRQQNIGASFEAFKARILK